MTTKTWNGASDAYSNAGDWTPAGVPGAGDTAVINSGTVLVTGTLPDNLALRLSSSTTDSPTLALTDAVLPGASLLAIAANGSAAAIQVQGAVTNLGAITVTSAGAGSATFLVRDKASGTATTLTNAGGIAITDGLAQFLDFGGNATKLTNNGTLSVGSTGTNASSAYVGLPVDGTGNILIGSYSTAEFTNTVGTGQTVTFVPSVGPSLLRLDSASTFGGTIKGFVSSDRIQIGAIATPGVTYTSTSATSGVLKVTDNGATVASLSLKGAYTASDFGVTTTNLGNGQSSTALTTTATTPSFSYFDTSTGVSGNVTPTLYDGPVNYLQWQYLWAGTDNVNIAASRNNTFLRGNTGSDALVVQGGSNVVDGGGGSDFITGATGADGGADTFFLDGRSSGVTWSTIQNFHHGDAVTIFGFNSGTSTLPAFTIDGAQGYQGATIHSELNGAGTGINASFTLTGLSLADAAGKLTVSSGAVGGTNYLYIQYTG